MSNRMYYSQEAENEAKRGRIVLAMVSTLTGMGIGTILALLFAPQSGEKTRKELVEQSEDTYHTIREATTEALERMRNEVEDRIR